MSRIEYRLVSVTDDAIYVLDSTKTSGGGKPKALLGTMPRHAQLGPVSGRWAQVNWMADARFGLHRRTAGHTGAGQVLAR